MFDGCCTYPSQEIDSSLVAGNTRYDIALLAIGQEVGS